MIAGVRGALSEAWQHRSFIWLLGSRFFILMTTGTVVVEAALFLERSLGYTEDQTSITIIVLLAITVLSAAGVAAWAGGASDRYGRRQVIWLGCAIGAAGMAVLALTPIQPEIGFQGVRFPLVALAAVPVGIGAGMFLAVDWALMVDIIPKATAGRYMGLSNVVTATSGALAGTIAGLVIAGTTSATGDPALGPRVAFLLTLVYYLVGALLLRRVDTRPYTVQVAAREAAMTAEAAVP